MVASVGFRTVASVGFRTAIFKSGSSSPIELRFDLRYADDKYDRIWYPIAATGTINVNTSTKVSLGSTTKENLPSKVMSTAMTASNPTDELYYSWNPTNATDEFYMYIYLAEIETLKRNQTRQFNIYLNGAYRDGPVSPLDHTTTTLFSSFYNEKSYELTMIRTQYSTLPPIFNAIELYSPMQLLQQQTNDQDAAAMWSTKSTYELKRNWQGDPCVPQTSVWNGVNCSYNDTVTPRIISLNLSSSGLSGEIAAALANLTTIQSLDLSYNNLTGFVPKFLASLDSLKILNLTGNNFTRPLPAELLAKSKKGSLILSIEDSSDQDSTGSCPNGSCKKKKHNKVIIPAVATIAAFFVLLITLSILWIIKRRKTQGYHRYQQYTYSQVKSITNSLKTEIGREGYGTIYHGLNGDKQVAVMMLSESSTQGYTKFQAEVNLLNTINHKNIVSLVGYCNDGKKKGIINEFMANGNLGKHLFDERSEFMSWERRLQIAIDVAEGLAHMHHNYSPPIVHRNVKSSNILLDECFQAKLTNFGLSRAFLTEDATPDPEYKTTKVLTEKSDVYSFGIVLLELITSKRAIPNNMDISGKSRIDSRRTVEQGRAEGVIDSMRTTVEQGCSESTIDPRLLGSYNCDTAIANKVVKVAMNCIADTSNERPTMNYVVTELKKYMQEQKIMTAINELTTRDEDFRPTYKQFTYSEMMSITNNLATLIGDGGFGKVYQGKNGDNQVAVKLLSQSSSQGYNEFHAEVKLLMKVHHKNITSLVGYCNDKNNKGIVYEFMANGNLEKHLFDKRSEFMSWERRLQIAIDAAEGLEYLHHGCRPPIVHRDVKCANILLNERFKAKIADFGLSIAFATEDATHVSQKFAAGTYGYLDPEYKTTKKLTEKSDVYSFGVVLLMLITSRSVFMSNYEHITNWIMKFEKHGVESIIDSKLQGSFKSDIAKRVVTLAMDCTTKTSNERPTMDVVLTNLKKCLKLEKTRHGTN